MVPHGEQEISTLSFTCPHCDKEFELPEDVWYHTCPQCHSRLDLKSQFAYLRGLDAFSEGQEIFVGVSPRKRRSEDPRVREAMKLFMEAYSSLQIAFAAELAPAQKTLGAEMMASMAAEFMKLNMVSPLEMTYWKSLVVEHQAQEEYDVIKEKLRRPGSVFSALQRLHWKIRRKQLLKALLDLDAKFKMLERQIEFIDIPRGRNENWKP